MTDRGATGGARAGHTVCTECEAVGAESRLTCAGCGGLVDLVWPAPPESGGALRARFDARLGSLAPEDRSGVWRFRELIAPSVPRSAIVTRFEGNTPLFESEALGRYCGLRRPLYLKHEGLNPTGSFKDRGMTVGVTAARRAGRRAVVCASTGNTSASLAAYAAAAGMQAFVLIPKGHTAFGKLSQALAYGARLLEVEGSFDDAMRAVEALSEPLGLYLLNSVNPWRIEGQKAIALEILQDRSWEPPDWIALPAGNLGNTSALGKALGEARRAGVIDRVPRLLSVQAQGASPFFRMLRAPASDAPPCLVPEEGPETVATAIRIGNPRSWRRALSAFSETDGVCEAASDPEILAAKAEVDRAGIGCEPASAASVAGVRKLVERGVIGRDQEVVCVLTGHLLKDPDLVVRYHRGELPAELYGESRARVNRPIAAPADPGALAALIGELLTSDEGKSDGERKT